MPETSRAGRLNGRTRVHEAIVALERLDAHLADRRQVEEFVRAVDAEELSHLVQGPEEHARVERVLTGNECRGDREILFAVQTRASTPDLREFFRRAAAFRPAPRVVLYDAMPAEVTRERELHLDQTRAVRADRELAYRKAQDDMVIARDDVDKAIARGKPTELLRAKAVAAEEAYHAARSALEKAQSTVTAAERALQARQQQWQMQNA